MNVQYPQLLFWILLILVLPYSNAARYILFDLESDLSISDGATQPAIASLPQMREAPAFRNGKDCLLPQSISCTDLCDPLSVQIAMTLGASYIRGSAAAILSIVKHTACPENVAFHFLAMSSSDELAQLIKLTFPYLRFKVYKFDEAMVKDKISASVRQALEQPLNFARSYIGYILPACVKRVIYLDSDLIVVDDIVKLWGASLGPHALGAPEYCHVNFSQYFTDIFWSDAALSAVFHGRKPCYFNTGVIVLDLQKWRRYGYSRAIEQWMALQKERRIYELGSLPPFLLVFAGHVQPLRHRWNQHGLGGDNVMGHCRGLHPGAVSLLHWSGKGKPWMRLDAGTPCPLDSLWAPYDLLAQFFA